VEVGEKAMIKKHLGHVARFDEILLALERPVECLVEEASVHVHIYCMGCHLLQRCHCITSHLRRVIPAIDQLQLLLLFCFTKVTRHVSVPMTSTTTTTIKRRRALITRDERDLERRSRLGGRRYEFEAAQLPITGLTHEDGRQGDIAMHQLAVPVQKLQSFLLIPKLESANTLS
jgi:hypothetical protein